MYVYGTYMHTQCTLVLAREEGHEGDCVQGLVGQLSAREFSKGGYQVQLTGEGEGDLKWKGEQLRNWRLEWEYKSLEHIIQLEIRNGNTP